MTTMQEIKNHLRSYKTTVNEEKRDANGEVFTPTDLVNQILDQLDSTLFNSNKTFLDHSCGNGQFLSEVLIRKLENNIKFEDALASIYGVEIDETNAKNCRQRLLCGREDLKHIVERNIVCADALRYHYRFDASYPYDDERKEHEFNDTFNRLFG